MCSWEFLEAFIAMVGARTFLNSSFISTVDANALHHRVLRGASLKCKLWVQRHFNTEFLTAFSFVATVDAKAFCHRFW